MAAWFTIFCTRSVQHLTAVDLQAALDSVDFFTVAEGFGIDDDGLVEHAVAALRVEEVAGASGERFELRYTPANTRPLVVYLRTTAGRVRQELSEVETNYLAGRRGAGRVRAAIAGVTEVAAVELGSGQLEDMGLVISGQVAEYLAGIGAGVIRDTDDEWWAIRDGVPVLLLGRAESD